MWIGLSQHPGHTHRLPRRVAVVQMQVAGGRGRHVERIILRHVLGQRSGSMGTRPERPLGRIEISLIGMASATGPGQARLRAQAISLSRPHLANDEAHALYHGYACSESTSASLRPKVRLVCWVNKHAHAQTNSTWRRACSLFSICLPFLLPLCGTSF